MTYLPGRRGSPAYPPYVSRCPGRRPLVRVRVKVGVGVGVGVRARVSVRVRVRVRIGVRDRVRVKGRVRVSVTHLADVGLRHGATVHARPSADGLYSLAAQQALQARSAALTAVHRAQVHLVRGRGRG